MTNANRKRSVRTAKQMRARATVSVILEASAQILADDGLAGLTTNAVAVRAGVSIGSLYEYFANKQALIDSLLDDHLEAGEAALLDATQRLGGTLSPQAVVEAIIEGYVRLHAHNPKLHRVLSSQIVIGAHQRARIATVRVHAVSLVASSLLDHVPEPHLSAKLLLDSADSLTHLWIAEHDVAPERLDALLKALRCMLMAYISEAVSTHG